MQALCSLLFGSSGDRLDRRSFVFGTEGGGGILCDFSGCERTCFWGNFEFEFEFEFPAVFSNLVPAWSGDFILFLAERGISASRYGVECGPFNFLIIYEVLGQCIKVPLKKLIGKF